MVINGKPAGVTSRDPVDVIIVGAGYTGLSAALEFSKRGLSCRIIEKAPEVGGLAAGFSIGDQHVERFYHHWFDSDAEMIQLSAELGISELLMAHRTETGLYYNHASYRLSTPWDLLRFTPLSMANRIRLGLMVLRAKRVHHWRDLDSVSAQDWLVSIGGRRVYEVVWQPLLEGKFGDEAQRIAATWMWTKLNLRGGSRNKSGDEVLYYIRGGGMAQISALRDRLIENSVEIQTKTVVDAICVSERRVSGVLAGGKFHPAKQVLTTIAPPLVADLVAPLVDEHRAAPALVRSLRQIKYLANICLVLQNNRRLSDTYWLNVNDTSFPYVGVIEHTNLEGPEQYGGKHIVYLSKYLDQNAPLYRMPDHQVYEHSLPYLQEMFPGFAHDWVDDYRVWRADYAQPVVTPGYASRMPPVRTELPGLFMASMAQVFPEDRGTNYAIRDGRRAAQIVAESLARSGEQE